MRPTAKPLPLLASIGVTVLVAAGVFGGYFLGATGDSGPRPAGNSPYEVAMALLAGIGESSPAAIEDLVPASYEAETAVAQILASRGGQRLYFSSLEFVGGDTTNYWTMRFTATTGGGGPSYSDALLVFLEDGRWWLGLGTPK
ncbi:hypothetical protein Afil01_29780 [Actinorhabdospora filicis]|uniref:Uncharacterized protein n=1 Tax=Actinorhabdospora filicis TaxID=1785913 RepID=A0A9W6WA29_9ACTN|nr:hypothetical protein [Actinorhabdospora filicis]GLZ78171.1 hypothetical protein Afil01_29780 [Actinorhabdospora filicis]